MPRPHTDEYADFYAGYVGQVPEDDILPVLVAQVGELERLREAIPAEREAFRYAEGKWSVREMLGHLSDAERVFGYRAWRVSRNDKTPLPGFDQNPYIDESGYDQVPANELIDELLHLRHSNLAVLSRLRDEQWTRSGVASGTPITVRALAFILAGHIRHHAKVLRERYGIEI